VSALLRDELLVVVAGVYIVINAVIHDEAVPAGTVRPEPQLAVVVEEFGDFDDLGGDDAHLGLVGLEVDVDGDVGR